MLIIDIVGGLGSQLSQYSMAVDLRHQTKADIRFSLSSFRNDVFGRKYQLGRLKHSFPLVDDDMMARIKKRSWRWRYRRWRRGEGLRDCLKLKMEEYLAYKDIISTVQEKHHRHNLFLKGDWTGLQAHHHRIYAANKDLFSGILDSTVEVEKYFVPDVPNVAVHIRRKWDYGDKGFVGSTDHSQKVQPMLEIDYYSSAVQKIREMLGRRCHFFIFGDSPEFAQTDLVPLFSPWGDVSIMPPHSDRQDLFFMSRCDAHIVANSNFSFWGAILSSSDCVVAPRHCYYNPVLNDLAYPPHWLRV